MAYTLKNSVVVLNSFDGLLVCSFCDFHGTLLALDYISTFVHDTMCPLSNSVPELVEVFELIPGCDVFQRVHKVHLLEASFFSFSGRGHLIFNGLLNILQP